MQTYTVIACDNRGMGDSSIPADGDYSAETAGDDLKAVLDFLKINQTYIFGHDKGTGLTTALAAKYRSLVKRVGVSEYPLPGFGYEEDSDPSPTWSLYSNWQLAFFSVPGAAEYFITGRVKEMLSWYFFHASYSGTEAVSEDSLNRYTTQLSKPGFLRSGLQYFSFTDVDGTFFDTTLRPSPLTQPALFLGGEASFAPASIVSPLWSPAASNLTIDVVPKAGNWIGRLQRLLVFGQMLS